MPKFEFKAYNGAGELEAGEVQAEDSRAALDQLSRRGLFPLEVVAGGVLAGTEAGGAWWQRDLFAHRELPLYSQAALARELATLVKADIPIDEVLDIVAQQPRIGRAARRLAEAVRGRVMAGASLSEALAAQHGEVPEHIWRLVGAGEASGSLPQALGELATYLEYAVRSRNQIVTAMLYPCVLLGAAAIAIFVILGVMVPAIQPLFRDAGVDPPFLITLLGGVERIVLGNWPVTLGVLAGLTAVSIWMSVNESAIVVRDRLVLKLPVIGGLAQRAGTARFARTLATLVGNGVPMLDALRLTAGVVGNRAFRAAILRAADGVNRGGAFLAPLVDSKLFPPLALRLFGLGEVSGQLPMMLTRTADIYEQDLQQQIDRILAVAMPAVTLFIGGLIGFLMLTVMSAMLALNETVVR